MLKTRCLVFEDYVLDEAARELSQHGQRLPISGKTFDLLVYMAANAGRPLLKKELLDAIWPDSFVEEANLTQNIFVLRKALGEAGNRVIRTLPGRGYQFTAEVAERAQPTVATPPGPLEATIVQAFEATETRIIYREETEEHIPFWRSPVLVTISAVALILLGVAGWLGWQRYEDRTGGPPVQVVLVDQEGTTGDPILDRTLTSILRFQLAQSPFVTLVPAATVHQTMQQMMLKADAPVTASVAQDLCERTSSQAVLRGTVVRAGTQYLLTEEATNCVDGSNLGAARQQVAHMEDLPLAIDKLGASIRHDLGESRRTIARYNRPLAAVNTASIEALKNFSQANYVAQSGRFPEAIALLKQAVALDPNFAAAYLNLSVFSANTSDPESTREYLLKAYELRADTTEPVRLFIAARYDTDIKQDLYQSLRDYKAWVELYPRSAQAWAGMTQVYRELGDHQNALRTARFTKELVPNNVVAYQALADAQSKTGDFAAARATCALAQSRGFDGENIRFLLLRLGHLLRNETLVKEQQDWADAHPDATILLANEVEYALQEGRFDKADTLIRRVDTAFGRLGSPQAATSFHEDISARILSLGKNSAEERFCKASSRMEKVTKTCLRWSRPVSRRRLKDCLPSSLPLIRRQRCGISAMRPCCAVRSRCWRATRRRLSKSWHLRTSWMRPASMDSTCAPRRSMPPDACRKLKPNFGLLSLARRSNPLPQTSRWQWSSSRRFWQPRVSPRQHKRLTKSFSKNGM